jgi:N-acetylmuramoyl-L-alanine amidase
MKRMLVRFSKCMLVVLMLLAPALATAALKPILHQVQLLKFPTYARLIFTVSDMGDCHVFSLANPNRLAVDFEHARTRVDLRKIDIHNSHIMTIRDGHPVANTYRLVFDLDTAVHYKKFVASNGGRDELVVDFYPKNTVLTPPVKKAEVKPVVLVPPAVTPKIIKSMIPQLTLGEVAQPRTKTVIAKIEMPIMAKPARKLIVVIDAGHGGKDPGTIGKNGSKEKDVVLNIAFRLARLINDTPNMHAYLTRNGDYFITLRNRLRLARKNNGDLFLAIHADSFLDKLSSGASVYALSHHGATTEAARWLASRENYSELGGVDLGELGDKSYILRSVLIDLAQTATISDSVTLGSTILKALGSVTKLHYIRVEQAPFMVLKSPDIPSVLVETGFLSNPYDEENLQNDLYREKLAKALLVGVKNYLTTHPTIGKLS